MLNRRSLLAMLATLPGCSVLRELEVSDLPVTVETRLRSIFVASDRATEPGDPLALLQAGAGRGRAAALHFGRVEVSTPPGHQPGRMEWALRGNWHPDTHFTARQVVIYPGPADFLSDVAQVTPRGAPVAVFVHGFNVASAEAVMRAAQMAEDGGARGAMVAFAWPSMMRSLAYGADRRRAERSRDALRALLSGLARGGAPVVVIAHSMGAELTMQVLRDMAEAGQSRVLAQLRDVVLMSPDMAPAAFTTMVQAVDPLPRVTVLASQRDQMLRLAGFMKGGAVLGASPHALSGALPDGLPVRVVDLTDETPGYGLQSHIAGMTAPKALAVLRDVLSE